MLFDYKGCLRGMAAVVMLMLAVSARAQSGLEPVGMSVYTETARDIYIAALRLPPGTVMQNLMLSPPPKAMEYRIATRRISSRGFSGTMLLQGELGSGGRAPEQAINALAGLKASMKGSLVQGDRFIIYLDESDNTVFLLNNTELLRVADGSVFDFFFSGWVGEGSAATFRNQLLAGTLNPTIRDRFDKLKPSGSRIEAVAAWNTEGDESGTNVAAATATAATATAAAAAAATTTTTAVAAAAAVPAPEAAAAAAATAAAVSTAAPAASKPAAEPAPAKAAPKPPAREKPREIAMAPTPETAVAELDEALEELDDRDYQRSLREYISRVMTQVYGEVRYPRRAIKYNWEGRVELLARLDASGGLLEVIVDSTSGHTGLDKAAQSAVERAAPFPELSAVAKAELAADEGDGYIMAIPVTFSLQR